MSRVDTNVDKKLDAHREGRLRRRSRLRLPVARKLGDRQRPRRLRGLRGGLRLGAVPRPCEEKGVALQRPLWASTSTKDRRYPDLYYVEALIGPDTVDTVPPETFEAYRDHGQPQVRIRDDRPGAHAVFGGLAGAQVDTAAIFRELEDEGIRKFSDSFDALLSAVAEKEKP